MAIARQFVPTNASGAKIMQTHDLQHLVSHTTLKNTTSTDDDDDDNNTTICKAL